MHTRGRAPAGLVHRVHRVYRHSLTRFAAFGALGLAVDLTLLALLHRVTPWPVAVCVTLAFAVTYAMNFALNRRFAFASHGEVSTEAARFLPQVGLDYLLTVAAVETMTSLGLGLLAARFLAGGTNATFNYCAYRWWTFRRERREPSPDPHPEPDGFHGSSDAGSLRDDIYDPICRGGR
jgi:putative flippase GtrA